LGDPMIVDGYQRWTCKEWAIIKYTEESWIPNSMEVGEWRDLNIGGLFCGGRFVEVGGSSDSGWSPTMDLQRVGNNKICRRIVDSKFEGSRRVGRPKRRLMMVWWKIWGCWGIR